MLLIRYLQIVMTQFTSSLEYAPRTAPLRAAPRPRRMRHSVGADKCLRTLADLLVKTGIA